MGRKNSSTARKELSELIQKYEAAKAEDQQLYLDADQLADIADRYATEQNFAKAQEVISYGLHLHPGNTDLLIEQSYLYLDTRNLKKAKDVAECISEEYETEVKMLKAELLLNEGKLEEARQLLDALEDADDLSSIMDIVYLYIDMGYPEEAKKWLDKGEEGYSHEEDYIGLVADYMLATHQIDEAIICFNKLIDKSPFDPGFWMGLAKCYFFKEDMDKCLEACDFALAADDKFGEAYAYKAHCFFYLNNPKSSIEYYQKAMEYKAFPPELAYMFMGMSYGNKEEWDKANDCYDKVIHIYEENNEADSILIMDTYLSKAGALLKLERYEEAHQVCEKAQIVNPNEALIYHTDGKIYLAERKKRMAAAAFKKALAVKPDIEMYYMIGSAYTEYDYMYNAKNFYEKAYKINPKYEDLPERLSIICIMANDVENFLKYNKECAQPLDEEFILKLIENCPHSKLDDLVLQNLVLKMRIENEKKRKE